MNSALKNNSPKLPVIPDASRIPQAVSEENVRKLARSQKYDRRAL